MAEQERAAAARADEEGADGRTETEPEESAATPPPPGGDPPEDGDRVRVDAECVIERTERLDRVLKERVVGQDHAVDALICAYARLLSGLHDPTRPLLTALLLGPTGVGKTETARAVAEALFADEEALTRVNCEEYAHGHELSKLFGSPPGYVGMDVEPLLSQDRIDEPHFTARKARAEDPDREPVLADRVFGTDDDRYESVILFDEIEKAHPKVWNALLGILEDGTLTLGDNRTTDFSRSIILLTSNVGSDEMAELLEGKSLGFRTDPGPDRVDEQGVKDAALSAARRVFPLEFLNRFDEVLVYSPLEREDLDRIFDKFLRDIQRRTLEQAGVPVLLRMAPEAMELVLERGTDLRFGARPLRRQMERDLVDPLSRLIASGQLAAGDVMDVERDGGELAFFRASRSSEGVVAPAG